ncbi:MAG: gliding motility-associated C-terminal domain-containing protein [Cytophagales bacterium]|nr:MAG: gliding motility-associated C-terminal domain-containing protein [Cytophagales bacterium]
MKNKTLFYFFIFLISFPLFSNKPSVLPSLSSFEINKGQFEASMIAKTDVPNGYLYVSKQSFEIFQTDYEKIHELRHGHIDEDTFISKHHYKISFLNSNKDSKVRFGEFQNTNTNYFVGEKSKHFANVKHTTNLIIENIYPNINLNLTRNDATFKYEYVLKKGSNISEIIQNYEGVSDLKISEGKLTYKTTFTQITELKPFSYQIINGNKIEIASEYKLKNNQVTFHLKENYNPDYDLIIDPEVVFSSFSGSFADNWGYTATYDTLGNMYLGGIQFNDQFSFPINTVLGAYQTKFGGSVFDMVFMKFSTDGKERLAATYFGGNLEDHPMSMIVNKKNELVVLGVTNSTNFATTNGSINNGDSDLIISKFDATLTTLVSSIYFGGTGYDGLNLFKNKNPNNYFYYLYDFYLKTYYFPQASSFFFEPSDRMFYSDEFRSEIQLDSLDNIYVASSTQSTDLPTTFDALNTSLSGLQDGLFAKFSPNLDLVYSTYIGGTDLDACHSVKIGANNEVFLLGNSRSSTLLGNNYSSFINAKPGLLDGFLLEFPPTLTTTSKQIWIGTASDDKLALLEIDKNKNVYVAGNTWSSTFLVTNTGGGAIYSNPNSGQFIQKYSPNLDKLLLSTRIGAGRGIPDISFTAFQVDDCDQVLIGGWYNSDLFNINNTVPGFITTLTTTSDAFQTFNNKQGGFYFAVYNPDLSGLRYATQFGGDGYEHVDGGTSRFDKKGVIYQAVCGGCRGNSNTKTTPNVWSVTNNSSNCNMLGVKINLKYSPINVSIATNPPLSNNSTISGRVPISIEFINTTSLYTTKTSFDWKFPDGLIISSNRPINYKYDFNKMGKFEVEMIAKDSSSCKSTDIKKATIFVNPYVDSLAMCKGDTKKFKITGGSFFEWTPDKFLDDAFSQSPTTFADTTQRYNILVSNEDNSYTFPLKTKVIVHPKTNFKYSLELERDIEKTKVELKSITNVNSVLWNFGNPRISNIKFSSFEFTDEGFYLLTVSGLDSNNCNYIKQAKIEVKKIFIPNIITPNGDGFNDTFTIRNLQDNKADITIYNRWGIKVFEQNGYDNSWDAKGVPDGIYFYNLSLYRLDDSIKPFKGWIQVLR